MHKFIKLCYCMTENSILDGHFTLKSYTLDKVILNPYLKISSLINYCAPIYMICSIYLSGEENDSQKEYNFNSYNIIVSILFLILPFVIALCTYHIIRKIRKLEKAITVSITRKRKILFCFYKSVFPLTFIVNILTIHITYQFGELSIDDIYDVTFYLYLLFFNSAIFYFYKRIFNHLGILLSFDKKGI